MEADRRHGWIRRPAALALVIVLFGSFGPAGLAQASDVPEEAAAPLIQADHAFPLPRIPGDTFSGRFSKNVWFSGRDRQVFVLDKLTTGLLGFSQLVRVDLDTKEETGRVDLSPRAYAGPISSQTTLGKGVDQGVIVDDQAGKIYIAYANPDDGGFNVPLVRSFPAVGAPGKAAQGEVCGGVSNTCFGGVLVLDAQTLQIERRIPVHPVRIDRTLLVPALRAMELSPAVGDQPAKLHLIVEEFAGENTGPVGEGDRQPRTLYSANNVFAVQLDPAAGTQDWSVRVEACRGTREPRAGDLSSISYENAHLRPYPAAVFRSRNVEDRSLYAACHSGTTQVGTVVQIPLNADWAPFTVPVEAADPNSAADALANAPSARPAPTDFVTVNQAQRAFFGPDRAYELVGDPKSGRVLMRVYENTADVWWVFDTRIFRLVGTIGVGKSNHSSTMAGIDRINGRLYVLATAQTGFSGGLMVADFRGTPLGQGILYPEFVHLSKSSNYHPLNVLPGEGDAPTVVYVPTWQRPGSDFDSLTPIVDGTPRRPETDTLPEVIRSHDVEEAPGLTQAAFDGAARGYGARVLLVGGAEAAARVGPADPSGFVENGQTNGVVMAQTSGSAFPEVAGPFKEIHGRTQYPVESPCAKGSRELVFGSVGREGPAVVDTSGSRGRADPFVLDSATSADAEAAVSRCSRQDWQQIWSGALFGQSPVDEPKTGTSLTTRGAECVTGTDPTSSTGDPISSMFAAGVKCEEEEASGFSYARVGEVGPVRIAEALSSYRLYRDPGRGIVARVESVARGISLNGLVRIDAVRGQAEAWSNGRRQPVAAAEREPGYNPNCDYDRTAGTCFRPHIFGVWTPGYSCGPCGDEATLTDRMSRALGANVVVSLRQPNPDAARGSEDGFIAAITKRETERFADMVLNNDLLQTVLPTLEVIRYAPPSQPLPPGGGTRGRQIYQFAGVEVSTSYGIQCLLVYDAEASTCAGEKQEPGAIQVSLSDPDGKALAGGAFEVRQDIDADGVLGLKDTLLPDGACVTADDGVGTCKFEALQPGGYLVNQVAAPPGYAKSAEPFVVELASGEQRTVAFTNVSNLSTVELKATDENGAPVSGAVFAAYPDPDSDGKVAPDAKPAAECTTGADGACSMQVPAGSYVLVQTSAPAGLEGIEPVAFTFASGGQVAAVTVVNYPPDTPGTVEPEASPVIDYSPPVDYSPPTEIIDESYVAPDIAEAPETVEPPVLAQVGDTITQVIRAPGDALRLLARDPKQAVAWTAALALFCLAVMAVRRRQQALALVRGM